MTIGSLYFSPFRTSAEGCGERQAAPESLLKAQPRVLFSNGPARSARSVLSEPKCFPAFQAGQLFRSQFPGGFFDPSSGLHHVKLCLVTRKLFPVSSMYSASQTPLEQAWVE